MVGMENAVTAPNSDNVPILFKDLDIPIALRKATRKCTQHPSSNFVSFHSLSPTQLFLSNLTTIESPKNVQEPLGNKNWRDVMNEEMHPLGKNGTWEMVELPRGKPIVGCKCVYTYSLERYKARLVAKE